MLSDGNTADIFEREQIILDNAVKQSNNMRKGSSFEEEEYHILVKEYGRLLKQLRRMTKIYDRATDSLNTSKLDLLDKVNYDALTGIHNRRYLEESFGDVLKTLCAGSEILSVMMLDIDYFKRYNDTYGHSEGDECLRCIAKIIMESLTRNGDYVARYGGEEFTVILPGADESLARVIANRILENIRALNILHKNNDAAPYVTISIGATTGRVECGQTKEDYIKRADEALYISKRQGRNRYTYMDFMEDK